MKFTISCNDSQAAKKTAMDLINWEISFECGVHSFGSATFTVETNDDREIKRLQHGGFRVTGIHAERMT